MMVRSFWSGLALFAFAACLPSVRAEPVVFARDLALSPDGKTLVFAWAGDLWSVGIEGGSARRLTVNPAEDSRPVWSPDGKRIAFASSRHGSDCVFTMSPNGDDVRRITFGDRAETPSGWSADGKFIYYHARKDGEVEFGPRVYRVPADGGQAWRAMECISANAVESPDGKRVAFTRGWSPFSRTGYRGAANHDVWIRETATGRITQLTDFDGTDLLPVWDATGAGVYFLSDRPAEVPAGKPVDPRGTHNVWYQKIGGPARQVTKVAVDRVRDFSVAADGKTLAYTHWDKLFVLDPTQAAAAPREITIDAGDDSSIKPVELRTLTRDADEIEASPDGKELALVVRGEIYVIKTEPDKQTRRVTNSSWRDRDVTWSPDGKALFFVSDEHGQEDVYRATSAESPPQALSDSLRFTIERVTDSSEIERHPQVSPDGKTLSLLRTRGDVILRDLASGAERVFMRSWSDPTVRWSPDSKWIAYQVEDNEFNDDIWIEPVDQSRPAINISQHPDDDANPQWSADGQVLAFTSKRQGFDTDLYMVFLSRELDEKSNVDLDEHFSKAGDKLKKRKPLKQAVASGPIALSGRPVPASTSAPAGQPASQAASDDEDSSPDADKDEADEKGDNGDDSKPKRDKKKAEKEPVYEYSLDDAYRRLRRIVGLPDDQSSFALHPAGNLIAFGSGHEGKPGLFSVKWNGEEIKKLVSSPVGAIHWTLNGQRLFYIKSGVPASCKEGGSDTKDHGFSARITIDRAQEAAQKFEDAARTFGLNFYHPTLKGLDWPALTAKYKSLAVQVHTTREFNEIFDFFQGQVNGSHLGIRGPAGGPATESVGYLGCEFDRDYAGPGLRVASILKDGPADRKESRLYVGDILLMVNGVAIGRGASMEEALLDTVGQQIIIGYTPSPQRPVEPATQPAPPPASAPASAPASGPAPAKEPVPGAPDSYGNGNSGATERGDVGEVGRTQPAAAAVSQPPESGKSPVASGTSGGQSPPYVAGANSAPASASAPASRNKPYEIVIRPIGFGEFNRLKYHQWVDRNAAYVSEKSAGRVAYTHIAGMAEPQFHVFERDLYAVAHGKEALIVDVRNNGGGWTADWVMAVLNVRRHAYTVPRGGSAGYPQDRLIFYSWPKPAVMMCNEYSYSNAEIVSHAFKTLKRGPLVGNTTFGAVISTGAFSLIDGTTVRMPFRGWYTLPDGVDMEGHGAEPDVLMAQSPEDEEAGRFPQLDAAIRAALGQLGPASQPAPGK